MDYSASFICNRKYFKIIAISILLAMFGFVLVFPMAAQNMDHVNVIKRKITSPSDIVPIRDSLVIPYVYTNAISLNQLPVPEKKQKFFDMLLPSVLVAKTNLDFTREKVETLAIKNTMTPADTAFLLPLMRKYDAHDIHELIHRLQTFPVCIILAQAAIESGWGSSRFFLKGNNVFGMWSFDSTENRMPTLSHRSGTRIYLQKFDNIEKSIDAYFAMLDTRKIFAPFRAARVKTNNPMAIIDSLGKYSERGTDYINDLARMIRVNHLQRYDKYRIAPDYLQE